MHESDGHEGEHHLVAQRRANREKVRALGLEPYGERTPGLVTTVEAKALYRADADAAFNAAGKTPPPGFVDPRPQATIAGRVVLHRDNGKLVWMNLRDASGDLQIAVSQRDCEPTGFELAKATDLGDIVVAKGRVMRTKTGEVTLWCGAVSPGSKCTQPPPAKHEGLADIELRYRQRYVDLWANPETMRVFRTRSRILARMRAFLEARGFLEVETPMLQTLAGGAAARPFVTHMNALDIDLFMRIAPELYLKRLLVGGMPKVFEINRNFRNEGLDKSHNPEFTVVELYEAFGDYHTMMELTESLIRDAAVLVHQDNARETNAPETDASETDAGETDAVLSFGELRINYSRPFERITYAQLFEKALGFPMSDIASARQEAVSRKLLSTAAAAKMDGVLVVNELFEEVAEHALDPARPTFVMDYPSALSPLTRPRRENPALAERWDLFIAGMEIGPAYTELNDPEIQEAKFREQLTGLDDEKSQEENTFRTLDEDFLRALRVGMPPAGGMGLGLDRLVMLLTNQRTIRDVILFPMMRPEA